MISSFGEIRQDDIFGHAWEFDVGPVLADVVIDDPDARLGALSLVASRVLAAVVDVWPVATALSLAGFRRAQVGDTYVVYNDVEYTKYVHDGLATRTAERAARKARPAALARVEQILSVRGAKRRAIQLVQKTRTAEIQTSAAVVREAQMVRTALLAMEPLRTVPGLMPAQVEGVLSLVRRGLYSAARRKLMQLGQALLAEELRRLVAQGRSR